jgi:Zn-dependent protease
MEQFLAYPIGQIPYVVVTLVFAFTLHEFMHAWMANKFGDSTAKDQGRVTLNPMKHLDVMGTILIFIAGIGWAKPVPINRFYFLNRRVQAIIVSLVGPLSNFFLAFVGMGIWYIIQRYEITTDQTIILNNFTNVFVQLNVVLGIFNLIPIPPLDGYRIVSRFFSAKTQMKIIPYEQYGMLLFFVIMMTPIGSWTILPFINYTTEAILSGFLSFYKVLF